MFEASDQLLLWKKFHLPSEGEAPYDPASVKYHQRVLRLGMLACLIVGLPIGIGLLVGGLFAAFRGDEHGERTCALLWMLAMPVLPVTNMLGASAGLLFAPHEFLRGPIGRKWLAIVGCKSPLVARIWCAFGLVLVTVLLVGITFFATRRLLYGSVF